MANGLFNLKQVVQAVQQGGWPAQKTPSVEYLVVAGGGSGAGGAGYAGGGGGAGGVLYGIDPVPNGQTLLVTVGAGGTADAGQTNGTSGNNSVFGQIVATGGGYGSYGQGTVPASGGSGGGTGSNNTTSTSPQGAQGIIGQGFAGGAGYPTTSASAGGGGGAGTPGTAALRDGSAGNGGQGLGSVISGTLTTYAGGGGGSGNNTYYGGQGGTGGGGNGATGSSTNAQAGSANKGAGGGGAGNQSSGTRVGGNGGSGVVIVSYPDVYAAPTATTGSPTVSTSGSGSVYLNGVVTSNYIQVPSSSAFAFGTGDFTFEFWTYVTNPNSVSYLFDMRSGNPLYAYISNATTINTNLSAGITVPNMTNTWLHWAFSRTSGVLKVFVNGTQVDSQTHTTSYTNSTLTFYNAYTLNVGGFVGYLSNVRVLKGTGLYTTSFTPPTSPLLPITNTSLLMSTVSGAYLADSSSTSSILTAVGAPAWNSTSPFTVTGYKNRVYTWTSSGSITF